MTRGTWVVSILFSLSSMAGLVLTGCQRPPNSPAPTTPDVSAEQNVSWGPAVRGLRYGLSLRKAAFKEDEPLVVSVHVQNVGKRAVAVKTPLEEHHQWRLEIYGDTLFSCLEFQHRRRSKTATKTHELLPGETRVEHLTLAESEWRLEWRLRLTPPNKLEPGQYRLRARYGWGGGRKGGVITDAVEVEVRRKDGGRDSAETGLIPVNDKEVMSLLRQTVKPESYKRAYAELARMDKKRLIPTLAFALGQESSREVALRYIRDEVKDDRLPSVPIIVGHEVEIKSEGVEGFGDV